MNQLYDAGGDLTTGVLEEKSGFERWEFFLRTSAVSNMLQKGARMEDPEYIKELPGRYWTRDSRVPSRYEVAELSIKPLDTERVRIEVLLRRGHWVLGEFIKRHPGAKILRQPDSVMLLCECHPGEHPKKLPLSSFPEKAR